MAPETIFVIDDDPDDLYLLRHAIAEAGLPNPVEIATNGEAGVDRLAKIVREQAMGMPVLLPAFVLLDLKMPRMSGLEVLAKIRTIPELSELAIVVLTGSNIQSDVQTAYELGARTYLVKPVGASELKMIAQSAKLMGLPEWLKPPEFPGLEKPSADLSA